MTEMAIKIYNLLKDGKAYERKELCKKLKLEDVEMRRYLEEVKQEYPVCNVEKGRGYFITNNLLEAERQLKKETKRARKILFNLKGLKEFIKGGIDEDRRF